MEEESNERIEAEDEAVTVVADEPRKALVVRDAEIARTAVFCEAAKTMLMATMMDNEL